MASPALPYWCWSSLIRTQLTPASSDRYTPRTPSIVAIVYSARFVRPGAGAPNPMLTALELTAILLNVEPESVEWCRPVSVASQMSPSTPWESP